MRSNKDLISAVKKGELAAVISKFTVNGRPTFDTRLLPHVLFWAVKNGHLHMTDTMLQLGADVNGNTIGQSYMEEMRQWTPHVCFQVEEPLLFTAVRSRCVHMVKLLLDNGANPNEQTNWQLNVVCEQIMVPDKTALHLAIIQRSVEIVKILLEHKANIDLQDSSGLNAFHVIMCRDFSLERLSYSQICLRFGEYLPGSDSQSCEIMQMLCNIPNSAGTLNARSRDGDTPLHLAARYSKSALCLLLIKKGVLLNTHCNSGFSPLLMNIVFSQKQTDIALNLIVHGADADEGDLYNHSLIAMAIANMQPNSTQIVHLLVFAGCRLTKSYQRPYNIGHEKLYKWLGTMQHNPHRLVDLSRICIRRGLAKDVTQGRTIVPTIMQLPLPESIKGFLLLQDITGADGGQ